MEEYVPPEEIGERIVHGDDAVCVLICLYFAYHRFVTGKENPRVEKRELFLVKWQSMSYSESTWEDAADITDDMKIAEFRRFNRPPMSFQRKARDPERASKGWFT